ncbi:MAG: rod shape-determining protein MreC [Prevotella sp.]|nr:rod shape-determining protein MreC [Prevotella sp.]MBR7053442.1 rod shape-determining protein MreC [Prevotella sp.]
MRNLIEFLKKYHYWFLFVLLEVVSLVLVFQYNNYQGSVWFTSANYLSGLTLETDAWLHSFVGQGDANQMLTERNLLLEREVALLREQLSEERHKHDSTYVDKGITPGLEAYKLIPAKVISNSINKADNLLTIDKGRYDGVHPDMGVACGNGVVGVVYMSSRHYSVVLSALNFRSNISCTVKGKGYFGYLHWSGGPSDIAYVDDIPRHALFENGDTITTSGYSSMFPPGVMVGTILSKEDSRDGLSYRLKVKMTTDFGNLRDVCVIDDAAVKEQLELLRQVTDSLKPQTN